MQKRTEPARAPPKPVFRRVKHSRLDPASYGLSRITVTVVALAWFGLILIFGAVMLTGNVRDRLAAAALDALIVQGDILTAVLTEASDGDRLIELGPMPGSERFGAGTSDPVIGTIIDRNRVERLFSAALEGSETTVRIYGIDGRSLTTSQIALAGQSDVTAAPLAPLRGANPTTSGAAQSEEGFGPWNALTRQILAASLPSAPDTDDDETPTEVLRALDGVRTAERRVTPTGEVVVALATPVLSPTGTVLGALQLLNDGRVVNALADDYDRRIFSVLVVALLGTGAFGVVVALYVAKPIRRLVRAAERVKAGGTYTPVRGLRPGTLLGRLNQVLADMTDGLFSRIDAIESFAGEVAHELKNPLTSLRSAVETLPLATKPASRERLLAVIDHDVRRIDRLISDISEASKLDAELTRRRYETFDLVRLVRAVVSTQSELANDRHQSLELMVRGSHDPTSFQVIGNDSRLGQVFINLIDNGRSFTPDGGALRVTVERSANFIEVMVDDQGPGIKEEVLERVFERFYTDREEQQSFGNNSGLGLSICRQIVEAHNGEIFAENRYRTTINTRDVAGARFTVRLPAAR